MASKYSDEERAERQKAASKKYREANRAKERARSAAYKAAHPQKVLAYVVSHRDQANKASMAWAKANPERRAAIVARHELKPARRNRHLRLTKEQKAHRVMSARRWQLKNPESVRAVTSNRRAKAKHHGRLTRGIVKRLMNLQKGRCANCSISLTSGYHVDHIQPLARGGMNTDANVQLMCPTCNMRKGAKDPFAWANQQGRLL